MAYGTAWSGRRTVNPENSEGIVTPIGRTKLLCPCTQRYDDARLERVTGNGRVGSNPIMGTKIFVHVCTVTHM